MQIFQDLLMLLHIVAGTAALLAGTGALLFKKGSKRHRITGIIFYWGMIIVALTALFISAIKGIPFLLAIAIFSGYMTYTGRRAMQNKKLIPSFTDWCLAFLTLLTSIYMVLSGNVILLIFGLILLGYAIPDLLHYLGKIDLSRKWLVRHISRMMGTYISTITAFLIVNITIGPEWVIWLGPAAILSPVIGYYVRKYGKNKTKAELIE